MKISYLIILMIWMVDPALAQKGQYPSRPYTGLSPKDGTAYLDIMQYDEKSKIMYLVRNDGQSLYIDLLMNDREVVQKTMMFGLTTWIDPAGKKKKSLGIGFPLPGGTSREQGPGAGKGDAKDRKAMMALAMQERNSRMSLKGFSGKGSEEEINPMTGNGFRGKFEMQEGGGVRIALVVPLEEIGMAGRDVPDKTFSLGFETGYMDLNRSGMAAGAGSGGGQQGGQHYGGPPSGGGMEGGSSGGGQRQGMNLNEMASPSKMWIKQVKLAETK